MSGARRLNPNNGHDYRHCLPVRLSCLGRSCQLGRACAPMIPHEWTPCVGRNSSAECQQESLWRYLGPRRCFGFINPQATKVSGVKVLEAKDVIALLRSEVARAGSQAAWAKRAGVSRIVVNKILNGRGLPTKKILKALKLRTVFVSEQKPPPSVRLSGTHSSRTTYP
jgi:hypothetical protein